MNDPNSIDKMTMFGPTDFAPRPSTQHAHAPRPADSIFWGEIAPCEHLVQIYNNDSVFMDALEGFVIGGIRAGDGVIMIATPEHLAALAHRLDSRGVDVAAAIARDQYITLDAEETLSKFMRPLNGTQWPDQELFENVVNELLERASTRPDGKHRRVRAFGEMVALLWQQGNAGATVRLEHLWHQLCHTREFSLFCAYPRAHFAQDAHESMQQICQAHSRVVPG